MSAARDRVEGLDSLARGCARALREIFAIMKEAERLRLGALHGSLGFLLGLAGATIACSTLDLSHMPVLVSSGAGIGGLLGLRLSFSREEIETRERNTLISKAIEARDEEVAKLDARIRKAGKSSDAPLLEFKRAQLMLASNDQLLVWSGLVPPEKMSVKPELLVLTPPVGQVQQALLAPAKVPALTFDATAPQAPRRRKPNPPPSSASAFP